MFNDVLLIKLEGRIEKLRCEMIKSGLKNGLNHPDTIKYSQQLDMLLNRYNRMRTSS
ncbi:aspartyl-phosphate phosphatase Spo0E family protein [Alkalihalophilus marmarensis]|uniref:aspartyl-phosphate phosphatase Spo0E family protein n=1 Tax=Alkalihalophilus marmarensis TaxID=521377 RepID=UPI002DB5D79C|nr:aspartyl-phosphate phosphatase Spo0E family protein [Alkalihalophilus marmarensis]MEC2073314.1 aspartyl-phosphate phosphatase Spo0E family protein [Alkalihalophilus marmarensis]